MGAGRDGTVLVRIVLTYPPWYGRLLVSRYHDFNYYPCGMLYFLSPHWCSSPSRELFHSLSRVCFSIMCLYRDSLTEKRSAHTVSLETWKHDFLALALGATSAHHRPRLLIQMTKVRKSWPWQRLQALGWRRSLRMLLKAGLYVFVLSMYIQFFTMFLKYLAWFSENDVYNKTWNFGQVSRGKGS